MGVFRFYSIFTMAVHLYALRFNEIDFVGIIYFYKKNLFAHNDIIMFFFHFYSHAI